MSRKTKAVRSSPIVPPSSMSAEEYLDIDTWPRRWRVEDRDLRPGEQMLMLFKPFLLHLLTLRLARKTLRLHRDHLCTLGGEIIRRLHEDPQLRRRSIERVLSDNLEEDGGPLIYPTISEAEQRSFDSTCRKLFRFLLESKPQSSLKK